ncbi:MAG: hypothetical protein EA376_14615 [Phycisphaeraceae bacterium]|nr:MAG: hypothetical protein EA376_14615 [Phycisphaeraceae bacterium]
MLRSAIVVAVIAWLPAPALSQNVDFGINDNESYDAFIEAVSASEFVRFDYTNNPRPRVAGVVAALMEFATRNPLASEAQLTDFTNVFAATMLTAAPGDPELRRSANFLPALRHTRLEGVVSLRGLDTNIGEGATALLGLRVPDPFDFQSLQSRMVRFEDARWRSFAHSPQWSNLLVTGLLGRDLNGVENPALSNTLRAFLVSEGYEPTPDGVDDERFSPVFEGLAQLPATYEDFLDAIRVAPGETAPPIWDDISEQFNVLNECMQDFLAELADADAEAPALRDGLDLYQDETILDQLAADLRNRLAEVAMPRTILAANALLLHQSEDPTIRDLARHTQHVAEIQSGSIDMLAVAIAGLKVVAGVGTVAGGLATMVAAGWTGVGAVLGAIVVVGGVAVIISGGATLYDELANADQPTNAEIQIFDQIVAVRQDIESMRVQMHERFDRIEMQLNIVFENMAQGFNALGQQIGDLQGSVDDLVRDVMINRAALERIEDALYGMAENLLHADLAGSVNTYLKYRGFNGVDLPYAGPESFLAGANAFFTFTVDTAQNAALAGPHTSALTVATADQLLNDDSIGRNVNDLRVFPAKLGLPRLATNRLVATAQWAQGAAGYAQLVRENPWYFAYQYEQQILSGIPAQDRNIERIIREGQRLADAMEAGQSQTLFDALFGGYRDSADAMQQAIYTHALGPRGLSDGVTSIDPWGPIAQDVRAIAPAMDKIPNEFDSPEFPESNAPLTLPATTTDVWGLFNSDMPQTAAVLAGADGQQWGRILWSVSGTSLRFIYESPGGQQAFVRELTLDGSYGVGGVNFRWNGSAIGFRDALLSSENLAGTSYGGNLPVGVLSDTLVTGSDVWTERVKITPPDMTEPSPGFDGQVAIDRHTMVIGAPFAAGGGAAYVYTRSGVFEWSLEAMLKPGDLTGTDRFGWSVAIDGDTVVIGAPAHNGNRGAAWVYTRAGTTWTQQAKITDAGSISPDQFGYSVAIDGDTAVIGAPFRDDPDASVVNAGAVSVFTRFGSAWTEQQRLLKPPAAQTNDRFGWSVSISGDTLIAGAPSAAGAPGNGVGAASVFTRTGQEWSVQGPNLLANDGAANHAFGWSVSIKGDVAMIGAPRAVSERGAAYFFTLDAGGEMWVQTSRITDANGSTSDQFGGSVAMDGAWAVTGAQWASPSQSKSDFGKGAAFITAQGADGPLPPIFASDAMRAQNFGSAVAVSGNTIVVGSRTGADPDQGMDGRPAAYVFATGSYLEPYVSRELELLQRDVLIAAIGELASPPGSNTVRDAALMLSNWESLLRAYATFSLPFAMETSDVLRAALGGNPATSEVGLRGQAVLPIMLDMLDGRIEQNSISAIMHERAGIAQDEIDDAIDADPQGHAHLNYMLAELRSLRDNAFNLAVPDTYAVTPGETLHVNSHNGLLANDILQLCRTIEVDTGFHFDPEYIAPQHGHVVVYSDGSFTYTPDPGFQGTDRFNYRSGAFVDGLGCQPGSRGLLDQHVFSDPADVVILVGTAQVNCPADLNGDGVVNAQDLGILLGSWGVCPPAPAPCPGDTNGDGVVNAQDLSAILGSWGACGK